MPAWQEIPLNSRSVLNWPRTGVASLTPNPDITVFVGRRRAAFVLRIWNLPQTKCLWWRQSQLIHWTFDGYHQKISWSKESFLLYLYGIHIPRHCCSLSLVDDPQCSSPVVDWFGLVGVGVVCSPLSLLVVCFCETDRWNVPISGNKHTGSRMQGRMSVPVHEGISHCYFCTGFAGDVCEAVAVHAQLCWLLH